MQKNIFIVFCVFSLISLTWAQEIQEVIEEEDFKLYFVPEKFDDPK